MLKERVITALTLLALFLPCMLSPRATPFAVLSLVMIAAAGWEWARLNGLQGLSAAAAGLVIFAGGALAWWSGHAQSVDASWWWVAMGAWVLGGAWVLRTGVARWPTLARGLRLGIGALVLWIGWLAIVESKRLGVEFLLSVLCLVWAADIAAYFGGRAFGRRKLAIGISPGKSWEGVWSGMLAVAALAAAWWWLDADGRWDHASLFTRMQQSWGWIGLGLGVFFLVAMSVVGDLFESLVKRAAGAKDSSGLLPGHGGVLDRIDALLPVFPLALALAGAGHGGLA